MPIGTHELKRSFIVVDQHTTVQQVRELVAATGSSWTYIVVALADDRYAVLRLADLITALQECGPVLLSGMLDWDLTEVPGLLSRHTVQAVDQSSMSTLDALHRLAGLPNRCLIVLADGQVLGLLTIETRGAPVGIDLDWLSGPGQLPQAGLTGAAAPAAMDGGGLLSADEVAVAPPPAAQPEKRWINAELLDHDPARPLQLGEVYTLAFDVDTEVRATSLVSDAEFGYQFAADEEVVELTVQLSSDDFEIWTEPQKLRVPRTGRSKGKARFDVEPKHEGEGRINAIFLKDGNFIQVVALTLHTGAVDHPALVATESLGRPLDSALVIQPRDLSLTILNTGTSFQVVICGAVSCMATLPITVPELGQMVEQARQELLGIVNLEAGGTRVYQAGIDIPPEIERVAMQRLARAGYRLYQRLFYHPGADAQANLLGDKLREMARQQSLKIQIVSQQFFLPWGILYMAEAYDPDHVDPELFLGLKHIIEHIPLQPSMRVVDGTINSRPALTVSLNLNADIDQQMGVPIVATQLSYWDRLSRSSGTRLIVRRTQEEVTRALADVSTADQIAYFYCHAASSSLGEAGGPGASCLVLSGGERLTLDDLNLIAPARKPLQSSPLVFINACESAELSPLFYDGFAPYFMDKGARGVIGTECQTPALFAAEWATRFFDRFLAGQPLGEVLLDLRREFCEQHRNLLGLLYALYCDGDTRIVPALAVT